MPPSDHVISLQSFQTFGDLLKYLRTRARLTQRELSIAVGYSESQISRLEQNQRPPDLAALMALFVPALYVDEEPTIVARLMELAAQARGEAIPQSGQVTFSHTVRHEITKTVRTLEDESLNNLPLPLTSFIGRAREIAEIKNLLQPASKDSAAVRLVTLTGSGGCGKTRLALEVASQLTQAYRDGLWLIDLAPISDPSLVLQGVTSTLSIPESRDGTPTAALTSYLRTKQTLLIFDNCEQVISATAQLVEDSLRSCPQLQILATSREVLNVPGEKRFQVPSLALPEDEQTSHDISSLPEALKLFVERAQAALPSFALSEVNIPAVTQICRHLDGMPLAIELAAARMTTLSVQQIAARLDDSFKILSGGRTTLQRHQTLQATMDWSYNLLSDSERVLLHRLSAFAGGWTLEAAEAVGSDSGSVMVDHVLNLLGQLVNKSLVVVDFQAETRYRLLEVVRQYSYERLVKSGEKEEIEKQHFEFFFNLVQAADVGLKTENHQSWLKRLEIEKDNLRAALARGQSARRYKDTLRFAAMLFWFWQTLGYIREGRSALANILTASSEVLADDQSDMLEARAKALWAAGGLAWIQADYASGRVQLEESVQIWRQLDRTHQVGLAIALRELGIISTYQGDLDDARSVLEESLDLLQQAGEQWNLALAFYNLGLVYETMKDTETARENFEQSLSLFRKLNEPWGLSVSLSGFGRIAGRQEDYPTARSHLEEALEMSRRISDLWSTAGGLYLLGEVSQRQNELERALSFFAESLILNEIVGDKAMISFTLHHVGTIAQARGEPKQAAFLFGAAKSLREDSINTTSWSLTDQSQCDEDILALRTLLGEETFAPAWVKGHAMNADEAIEYALGLF
jgi:predicted ATPase/transcriptional regulator with XRE-family HTH domain